MNKLQRVPDPHLPPRLRVARQINEQRDLAPLIEAVLEEAQVLAGAEAGVLWLYREEGDAEWLDCARHCSNGPDGAPVCALEGPRLPLDDEHAHRPAVRVARSGQPRHLPGADRFHAQDLALLVPPLTCGPGKAG